MIPPRLTGYGYEENIKQICAVVVANNLFSVQTNGRDLLNVFTGQQATHEQTCDMLSFRQVGEQAFRNYVKFHILQCPSSTKAPLRQHKLMTIVTTLLICAQQYNTHTTMAYIISNKEVQQ